MIEEQDNSEASSQDGQEVAFEDQPVSHTPKKDKSNINISKNENVSPDKSN